MRLRDAHILFLHQNFPAQFGHLAIWMAREFGTRCTFVSEKADGPFAGIDRIRYRCDDGTNATVHPLARTFDNQMRQSDAVFRCLQSIPDLQPDLIVSHSGFVSSLLLRELYSCPQVSYFEYFYRSHGSDLDFRQDLAPVRLEDRVRVRARNAVTLLDLENCDGGYSPTTWQRDQLPREYREKVRVLFDGIDTELWKPATEPVRRVAGWTIPEDVKVVTYCSRGMESLRGFDIFMKLAKRLCEQRTDVLFLVAGEDRVAYGGDQRITGGKTFKQWVLENDQYDLNRILFLGRLPPTELARMFSRSDLHVYLTAPFVLSWSLFNALSCGALVLSSRSGPECDVVTHGVNGWLTDFFDLDAMCETANQLLDDGEGQTEIRKAAQETIVQNYSSRRCLPQIARFFEQMINDDPDQVSI